jgi:hypothetical protein
MMKSTLGKKAMQKKDSKMTGMEDDENQSAILGKKSKMAKPMAMDTDMDGMKKGGTMKGKKKYAAGGAAKVRKGVAKKDGTPNPNAC